MKKFVIFFFFYLFANVNADDKIVYLDIQYIIDNSILGIHYKSLIKNIENDNKTQILIKQKQIKEKEQQLKNQKKLIKEEEFNLKIVELNKLVKKYNEENRNLKKILIGEKQKYTTKMLKIINPIITSYVEDKNINLVIEKKNVLVGIKTLDITKNILDLVNEETNKKKLINETQ